MRDIISIIIIIIINGLGFCDIQYNHGLGKSYQPKLKPNLTIVLLYI